MQIFTLLECILNELRFQGTGKLIYDRDTQKFVVEDVELIDNCVLPLVDKTFVEGSYRVIENGDWYVAYLSFDINHNNKRGELQRVTFVNSEGEEITVPVAQNIGSEMPEKCISEIYYMFCDVILCFMT